MGAMIWKAALLALAGYGAATALAYVLAGRALFQPPPPSYRMSDLGAVRVPVGDGATLAVQHLVNPDARFTLLFSHGNAEDLGHLQPFLRGLRDAGFSVLAYDYRGYGRSAGTAPGEASVVEDAEAVYRYAVDALGIPPGRLVLHGRSLGAGPTLALATRHQAAAVVLESAFTSVYRVVTRWRVLPFDRFPNLARVRRVDGPVLVIHGTEDRVIPVAHGRALFAAAPGPKRALWVEGAGHNDLAAVAGTRYAEALRALVAGAR